MGIRDRLWSVGRNVIGVTGDVLSGWAEDEAFWIKADNNKNMDPESDERAPGGTKEDTPESAPPPQEPAEDDPKSLFWDPFSIIEQLGYKDKPSNVTYGTLKAIVWKVPIVQAIIKTRINQMASFCTPSRDRYDMGFKFIKRGQPKEELSPAERKWAEQMETIILRTGVTDNPRGRDSFETFTRKFMRDSMIFDQGTFEIVPNRKDQPAEWYAIDSSTIRLADSASTYLNEDMVEATRYVQIYDGMVITEYTQEELCFGVRNPSTDMRLYGYGTSELEMLMNVVTALLWSWEYNQRAFSQGSAAKGILNFKGTVPDKQLKAFRRHWYQMLSGVENAWRTPITNADEIQWVTLQNTNREMEYSAWFDFLIKVACGLFDMDPIEINFKYGNTGQRSAMQDQHNRDKIAESRERGLRPLLRYFSACLNRHIIWPLNEGMELVFIGLDSQTKDEVSSLNQKRVKTTHTVNELRAEDGLEPLEDGDIILDPTYLQNKQQAAAAAEGGMPGEEGEEGEEDDLEALLAQEEEEEAAAADEEEAAAEEEEEERRKKAQKAQKSLVRLVPNKNNTLRKSVNGKKRLRKSRRKNTVFSVDI